MSAPLHPQGAAWNHSTVWGNKSIRDRPQHGDLLWDWGTCSPIELRCSTATESKEVFFHPQKETKKGQMDAPWWLLGWEKGPWRNTGTGRIDGRATVGTALQPHLASRLHALILLFICKTAQGGVGGWGGSLSTAGSAAPRTPRSTQPGAAQLTQVRHGAPLNGRRL